MTLMLAAEEPTRFAAAVDLYGLLDLFSMLSMPTRVLGRM